MQKHDYTQNTIASISDAITNSKNTVENGVLSIEGMAYPWDAGIIHNVVTWFEVLEILGLKEQLKVAFEGADGKFSGVVQKIGKVDSDAANAMNNPLNTLLAIKEKADVIQENSLKPVNVAGIFSGLHSTIWSIDEKYNKLDFDKMTDEEKKAYYETLMAKEELTEEDKKKVQDYLEYLGKNIGTLFVGSIVVGESEHVEFYVNLYEKIHPDKAECVQYYINNYMAGEMSYKEIADLKYQIYNSEYRYNMIYNMRDGEIKNNVYSDDKNYYGGQQSYGAIIISNSGKNVYNYDLDYQEEKKTGYLDILKKNLKKSDYSKMSEKELLNYLSEMSSNGCGYQALVNTIFVYFEGHEKEFKDEFGYSMYDSKGHLNYDLLMLDIYSYRNGAEHGGTNACDRSELINKFMSDHGVNSIHTKEETEITPNNYYEHVANGEQIILYGHYTIDYTYYNNGSEIGVHNVEIGRHAVTVTGVTEDGKFIVSTWGYKGIVDPNETGKDVDIKYQSIKYT